ncbi:MaoC/PaaZ C-terminal domain-containing protein [Faunimonas sp. B44]|uniref:MaoC/PaaZ C-terminal domain-containing protein n=1 Tax=Faunimonas sp. B44 TaxID=3461493 RepID=UPI004043D49D
MIEPRAQASAPALPLESSADMLHFEDFAAGAEFGLGSHRVSAEEVAWFAAEFAPVPEAGTISAATSASPWQLSAILMRVNYDAWMNGVAARGAPGVDDLRWGATVQAGDTLSGRATVLATRRSRSRPAIGFVTFRFELMIGARGLALSQTNSVMIARRDCRDEQTSLTRALKPGPREMDPPSPVALDRPWRDVCLGSPFALGTTRFEPAAIVAFARRYDPQPFHLDETAARTGPFGALAASGWHTAASWGRAFLAACRGAGGEPGPFLAVSDLKWLRPVYAGDTVAWSVTPLERCTGTNGEEAMIVRGAGTNQDGVTVYEFCARTKVPPRLP